MAKICQLHADLKYYLCMQPVDMRKQFQGLQGIVNEEFGRYLTQDEAFVFVGKTLKTVKILHRESNGLTMYVRRLSEGRFQMPHWNDDYKTCSLVMLISQIFFVPLDNIGCTSVKLSELIYVRFAQYLHYNKKQ